MGRRDEVHEPRPLLREIATSTELLLRGPGPEAGRASDDALERWTMALLGLPAGAAVLLRTGPGAVRLELHHAEGTALAEGLPLARFGDRARALGLHAVALRGVVPQSELFQAGSLLVALARLRRPTETARDIAAALLGTGFSSVHFAVTRPEAPPPRPDPKGDPAGPRLQALTREAGRVLLHDIRGLPAKSTAREALVRVLLALLSQIAREQDPATPGLFAMAVEELALRDEEWRTLVERLDPRGAESFLWAFLDQIPDRPAPGLYETLLGRARDVLPTLLRHGHCAGRAGVRRIVDFLLRQDPALFEELLQHGSSTEACGALGVYEQAGMAPPLELLQELATRIGPVELRSQAARLLLAAEAPGPWPILLLGDPVRELRRIALQALCGRKDKLAEMISSYVASESGLDAEERRWRLIAIAACGGAAARAFLHEKLDVFPEIAAISADAAPGCLAELRARISL